ncbi:hypothetical protein [Acinetobacter sp. LMB-5]|uniref:hypothetical protein n=1 Tax=Acinetobacter sp. LMB-5 TaxID=1609919 RepID=UPI0007619AF6|nr:hypothetical protein [Acinetobacter sp. LMB-5]
MIAQLKTKTHQRALHGLLWLGQLFGFSNMDDSSLSRLRDAESEANGDPAEFPRVMWFCGGLNLKR